MTNEIKNGRLAVIRVRGITGVKYDISKTLNQLALYKKNFCVVVPKNESYLGMLRKVNDYVTWGSIDDDTYKFLVDNKGEEYKDRISDSKGKIRYKRFLDINGKKMKKIFRLNSPRRGYGRKGIKVSFIKGGALGYRGKEINDLIKRMV